MHANSRGRTYALRYLLLIVFQLVVYSAYIKAQYWACGNSFFSNASQPSMTYNGATNILGLCLTYPGCPIPAVGCFLGNYWSGCGPEGSGFGFFYCYCGENTLHCNDRCTGYMTCNSGLYPWPCLSRCPTGYGTNGGEWW